MRFTATDSYRIFTCFPLTAQALYHTSGRKSTQIGERKSADSYCIFRISGVYCKRNKYIQRQCVRKGRQVRHKAKQGNGVRRSPKPRIDQYRVRLELGPLAKASHWGNLRRQGLVLFEARVGRPTVNVRVLSKNGYGDILPIGAEYHHILRIRRIFVLHPDRQAIYQATIRRMVTEALDEKEKQFASKHDSDTDAQLAAYLRQCAMMLSHTPHAKEIVGWQYLLKRFGTWEQAIRTARLPLPTTPNTPSRFQLVLDEYEHQQALYRRKKAEKKQKHQQRIQKQAEQRRQYAKEQEKLKQSIKNVQSGTPLPPGTFIEAVADCLWPQPTTPGAGPERQPAPGQAKESE